MIWVHKQDYTVRYEVVDMDTDFVYVYRLDFNTGSRVNARLKIDRTFFEDVYRKEDDA